MKIEFFILEDDPVFETLTEKQKIIRIVERASKELKSWYCRLGAEGRLPVEGIEFKRIIQYWCQGNYWANMNKYKEELWNLNLGRLLEKAGFDRDSEVLNKVSKEITSKNYKILMITHKGCIKELIEKFEELEHYENIKFKKNLLVSLIINAKSTE